MATADVSTWVGALGGASGVALAVKYLAEAWRNRRQHGNPSPVMADAATANATLVQSLAEGRQALLDERAENRAKDERIDKLETTCEQLRQQIVDQRNEYDEQVRALQSKVFEVTRQLDDLRRRLEDLPPLPAL